MSRTTYRFIDLFCGAGGFSLGFHLTNRFQGILAIDNFKYAALTYKANFPRTLVLNEDIKDYSNAHLLELVKPSEVDVIIGSPPCEPFTGANPSRERNPIDRLYLDPQGQLTLHYIRIVGLYKPKIFVMENVPAIMDDGLKNALLNEFKRIGYPRIYFNVLKAEEYETPSRRTRVFISNIPINPSKSRRVVTVLEALKGLPPPGAPYVLNHEPPPELPWRKLKKATRLKAGDALVYYQGASGLLPNLIKLKPHSIAPTVLGSSRFIHPFENRLLTVREQARLMGFPDSFVFIGGRDSQYNMVGEAVPAPLAKRIADIVAQKLDEGDY
ncbi:MAG: DNA cytosine methyltransferase [Desulfurococcaceae archaeon]